MKLHELTIHQARERLKRREITAVALTEALLERITAVDPRVKAFITVAADSALAEARTADQSLAGGSGGPLTGIPLAV